MKISKAEIARQVGISRSTLYLELKRGTVIQMNSDLTHCKKYFSDVGQRVYKNHRKNSRKPFKISQVENFMNFAEEKILQGKWSLADLSKIPIKIFFAHPYSSWERGTNGTANLFPKFPTSPYKELKIGLTPFRVRFFLIAAQKNFSMNNLLSQSEFFSCPSCYCNLRITDFLSTHFVNLEIFLLLC